MMDADTISRMIVEIVNNKPPAHKDTAEEARVRAQLTKECDEIRARGGIVDVPSEIPDL